MRAEGGSDGLGPLRNDRLHVKARRLDEIEGRPAPTVTTTITGRMAVTLIVWPDGRISIAKTWREGSGLV